MLSTWIVALISLEKYTSILLFSAIYGSLMVMESHGNSSVTDGPEYGNGAMLLEKIKPNPNMGSKSCGFFLIYDKINIITKIFVFNSILSCFASLFAIFNLDVHAYVVGSSIMLGILIYECSVDYLP
ncbi:hypothetical protein RF11_04195 [Thelohanellus kitauei]|uniref:Uncharacterized protein n=1 Tax=Thelohanellus kitauei TaxID=669202 RepID=A0A0C2NFJ2_THEKT|nr:hypothetical protein RF11_04195 [Thelohanellus kitauei]